MQQLLPGAVVAPHLHPLLVHVPITLWLTALLCWGGAAVLGSDRLLMAGRQLLYLGTSSAVAAVVSGFLAAGEVGHEPPLAELVQRHRDYMLIATALMLGVTAGAIWTRRRPEPGQRWTLFGALLLSCAVAVLGADRGALLLFGYRVGTAEQPPPLDLEPDDGVFWTDNPDFARR